MSIKSKIQNLITAGNEVTGNEDTNLTDVVQALIDGYGQSGTKYTIQWNLVNTTSTSNKTSISEGSPLTATLSGITGYDLNESSVVVTMGGLDVTATAYSNGVISIASVTGNITITATSTLAPIDLLNVTWANHAITCGQTTNNYNAWSPHNLQYDDVHDCFAFLQCHASGHYNGTYTNWTLSIINPYDSTDYENITIPSYNGLGMLFIENGVWTLLPMGGNVIYQSNDRGVTWNTIQASIPAHLFGVYKCGNTYFAGNDSNNEITYYKSSDLITWETVSFDSSLGYSILCETTFCEFDGKYWAFNRTNDASLGHPVILQSTDQGETWTLFSDSDLHGYRSTVSCYPFKNYIVVADIDRDNAYLYYTKFDGTSFTELNSWTIPYGGDDFNNVNIASNYKDTVILEFMHAAPFNTNSSSVNYATGYTCDNVMLVGSTKSLPSLNFDSYIDNQTDFVTYANQHFNQGIRGNTYNWSYSGGGSITIKDSPTTFEDEIELPLNFMQYGNTTAGGDYYLMNGGKIVWPWSYDIGAVQKNAKTSSKLGFVTINNNRYVLCSYRNWELRILFRVNYTAEMIFNPSSSQNNITGQSWQESLGFRRTIPINKSKTAANITPIPNGIFGGVSTWGHAFAFISYTPVSQQAS